MGQNLERLIVCQLIKKCPALYGTRNWETIIFSRRKLIISRTVKKRLSCIKQKCSLLPSQEPATAPYSAQVVASFVMSFETQCFVAFLVSPCDLRKNYIWGWKRPRSGPKILFSFNEKKHIFRGVTFTYLSSHNFRIVIVIFFSVRTMYGCWLLYTVSIFTTLNQHFS